MSKVHDGLISDHIAYHRRKAEKLRSEALFALVAKLRQKLAGMVQRREKTSRKAAEPAVRSHQWA